MIDKVKNLYKRYEEIIKYVIVGGLTTVVSMACFYASVWTFLDGNDPLQLQIANIISWIGGVAFAYVTNRTIVFKSENRISAGICAEPVGLYLNRIYFDKRY